MAQSDDWFVGNDHLPPTSPIQRILIAHFNLHAVCVNGESLGENASLEEISEEILFYHRSSSVSVTEGEDDEWNLTPANSNGSCLKEAVSFLGLCKALHALPSSLTTSCNSCEDEYSIDSDRVDSESNEDRTNSIYFGNSILVFVPLESTIDIVAIVQVSKLYQNGVKSDTGSGNPLAISASIERTHRLFCILHGGGIICRLSEPSNPRKTKNDSYPGMKKVFSLLKVIRERKATLSTQGDSSALDLNIEIARRIVELEEEVKACRESLPIQSLRRDLESHYNEYLSYFLEVCIRSGGAGRCLVELMPVPIAQNSGSHIFQLPRSKIRQRCLESLEDSILQIFQSYSICSQAKKKSDSSLLGIATFESSRLLHSFFDSETVSLSNDTVRILLAHMASYRAKMRHATMSVSGDRSVSSSTFPEPPLGFLKRFAFHLGPMIDKMPNQMAVPRKLKETDPQNVNDITHCRGRFLAPPPRFMLGASDQLCSVHCGNNTEDIWAPRVHLPSLVESICSEEKDTISDRLGAHMVVFEFLSFSFLIFMDIPSPDCSDLPLEQYETISLLTSLEEKLSEAIICAFRDESRAYANSLSTSMNLIGEPGQDIIVVEQSKKDMVLLLNRTTSLKEKKSQISRFIGLGLSSQYSSHRSTLTEWSALGLDCRHMMASRLSLDICIAFDDMINEVRNAQQATKSSSSKGEDNNDESSSSTLELCTCIPCGWVYALATQKVQIYVFFDSSIYVTFANVQFAVRHIKETYIETA